MRQRRQALANRFRHAFDQSPIQGATVQNNARPFDPERKPRPNRYLESLVRFVGPLAYMAAVPTLYRLHMLAPLILVLVLPVVLLVAETMPKARGAASSSDGSFANRIAVWLTIAAQLFLIAWGAVTCAGPDRLNILILSLAIGLGAGIFGMLAAHEMIHSRHRFENALGALMLTAVTYRHFRISHLFGHHRWAATPRDPATARRGENAYAFLGRSILGQAVDVYQFERLRVGYRKYWRNSLFRDLMIYLLIYSCVSAMLGWPAAVFLGTQSLMAVVVLELFNYVAHYGLDRGMLPAGGTRPLSDIHSWNVKSEVGNWLLLDMGHHSDHHRRPPRSQDPQDPRTPIEQTPLLPAGYSGAILLALVPVLWRRYMDRRVEHWMANTRNGPANTQNGPHREPFHQDMPTVTS
jgi:alkane 1-monooxygenase